jgi:predicted CoA-binding protein
MAGEECEMPRVLPKNEEIDAVLKDMKTIAMVGASDNPERDAYRVAKYLVDMGFTVIPVNPRLTELFGQKAYPDLKSIPSELHPVDVVDIFRKPDVAVDIVKEALEIGARSVWLQEGVINNEAAFLAREAGIGVVMNRCIKKELMARNR